MKLLQSYYKLLTYKILPNDIKYTYYEYLKLYKLWSSGLWNHVVMW